MSLQLSPMPLARLALAILCLCGLQCGASPHFDCQSGPVQFETVHLQDHNVIFLRQGPHCPEVPKALLSAPSAAADAAPSAPSSSSSLGSAAAGSAALGSAALGSASEGSAVVATDGPSGSQGVVLPASAALHGDDPTASSAARMAGSSLPAWVPLAGALLAVLAIAGPAAYWDQRVRRPRLLAQKELEEQMLAESLEAGVPPAAATTPADDEAALAAAALAAREWSATDVDAIVVPGGGLAKDGALPPWIQERLRRAADIHQEVSKAKGIGRTLVVTMCEGIRNSARDPRLRGTADQKLESKVAADFLQSSGVSALDIILDDLSLDTIGNAYFLRTSDGDVVKARSLVVVTNDFHAERARAIFKKMYSLGPFLHGSQDDYKVSFEPVPNLDIEPSALRKRESFERQQLEEFERVSREWRDLHDVHAYLFSGELNNSQSAEQRGLQLPLSFADMKAGKNQQNNAENNAEEQQRRRKPQYDDMTHAYQLAVQQQEERSSQQEADQQRQEQKPAEPPPEQKKGCGPFNCGPCSHAKGVSEPEGR